MTVHQQILISGVGGQGVLFVTRLLAEVAMMKGYSVLTSETHGMAQRGGTVVSHLKVGDFSSPLIRPFSADGLLALKSESLAQHGNFIKPAGWVVVNANQVAHEIAGIEITPVDADAIAVSMGNLKSVNLIMLGVMLTKMSGNDNWFCSLSDIRTVLEKQFSPTPGKLEQFVTALNAGTGR
jgi:indolepyruvate ferredoxin oxidoreductase, beta subunit